MATKTDARQIVSRDLLSRLTSASGAELDNILRSINSELTPPFEVLASSTPNLVVTVNDSTVTNPETSRKRGVPAITLGMPKISGGSGTITFPAASGGTITVSPGNNSTLVCTTGNYAAVLIYIDASNNLNVLVGTEAATLTGAIDNLLPSPSDTLAIGFVVVQNIGGTIQNIQNSAIYQFAAGSGGGGSGDGNEILETLKNHFQDSYFELLTPNVFSQQEDSLVDGASTGAYSLVDKSFNFASTGQTLVSTNLLDPSEFLASPESIGFAELYIFWKAGSIDTAATYEISRNGGNEWQAVTMERVGTTEAYRGFHQFDTEGSNQTILSEAAVSGIDNLNSTTRQEIAQKIVITNATESRRIQLLLNKASAISGQLYAQIRTDNAGSPSTTVVAESNAINIGSLALGNITVNADFQTVLAAGTYHIVLRTDSVYKAGAADLAWRRGTGSEGRVFNGTTWSTTGFDYGFNLLGIALDLRIRVTSSAGSRKLDAYGVFYKKPAGQLVTGVKEIEIFKFSGDLNTTSFVVNNFIPNPDTLRVYDVNSGQVYRYGAFTVQGQTIQFESGQFLAPGENITLIFDQTSGSAYDNSDVNALLLAANHLGSTDATIDKSVAGRGIFLRRPDGTLVELTINNDNEIEIYSV